MKIIIDTNVLVDYLLSRQPFETSATKIMILCRNKEADGGVAVHSLLNIFYILRKDLTTEQRRIVLKDICAFLDVVGIDRSKVLSALGKNDFTDFEDCLQSECAEEFQADYIVTRNIKDFKYSRVPAITPDEFLEKFNVKNK